MKSSIIKNLELNILQDLNSPGTTKYVSCQISKTEPLNERKQGVVILPILPKKRQNLIRTRQLEALRQKQNKMLAFYFYQKSLSSNQAFREAKRKFSVGNSRVKACQKQNQSKSTRPINHYSFMQMKNTISEKAKYLNDVSLNQFKVKKVILS